MINNQVVLVDSASTGHLENTKQQNSVYYSELKGIHSKGIFRNFSIKYVDKGNEFYKVNGTEYKIEQGMLLLAGKNAEGEVYFDSKEAACGLCIDIKQSTICQAMYLINSGKNFDFDISLEDFSYPLFFDHTERLTASPINYEITTLLQHVKAGTLMKFNPDDGWYLDIAEKIIRKEASLLNNLKRIKTKKQSTRMEILRRLLVGKEYIDDNFLQNPQIIEVAKACALSEFHFFRSFKQAFGISPYVYMADKRLTFSKELMLKHHHSLVNIALLCGYADFCTFSKAFKRKYKMSPSAYVS